MRYESTYRGWLAKLLRVENRGMLRARVGVGVEAGVRRGGFMANKSVTTCHATRHFHTS